MCSSVGSLPLAKNAKAFLLVLKIMHESYISRHAIYHAQYAVGNSLLLCIDSFNSAVDCENGSKYSHFTQIDLHDMRKGSRRWGFKYSRKGVGLSRQGIRKQHYVITQYKRGARMDGLLQCARGPDGWSVCRVTSLGRSRVRARTRARTRTSG